MAEGEKLQTRGIIKGILVSMITAVVGMLLLTAVCYFSNISNQFLGGLCFFVSVFCVFLGGFFVARSAGRAGLLHGILLGGGFYLILLVVSWILQKGIRMDLHLITLLVGSLAGGMLGGIMGVNTKN